MVIGDGAVASFGIGNKLRKKRERLGLTVDDVASQTRIPARFLHAIESEQLVNLPGLVFARNFVRQYATHLTLDPEPLLNAMPQLDESHIQLPVPPSKARSARWDSRGKSLAFSAAWLIAIAGIASAAWTHRNFDVVARVRAFYPHAAPSAAPRTVQSSAVQAAGPDPVVVAFETPVAAPLPVPPPSEVKVVVKARETSWVSLAADGKAFFSGILQANETREISAAEQVKLVAGNAGGVTVSLNGRELEPIGPPGQVRVVRLTAEGPEFRARAPHPTTDPL